MDKPEYRFECRIVDTKTDEVIVKGDVAIDQEARYKLGSFGEGSDEMVEESAESEFWSMFRAFRRRQKKYEEENYQEELEESNA